MWEDFKTWVGEKWKAFKAWFNYSWSIFIARMEIIFGVILAALGSVDFSLVFSRIEDGFKWTEATIIGLILVIKGIASEVGRRQGTVTLSDGQLLPSKVSEKVEAKKVIDKGPAAAEVNKSK